MFEKLPEIPRDQVKDWNLYDAKLSNYPLIQRYFYKTFKQWVERIENPLEVPILRTLNKYNLKKLEESLRKMEIALTEDNLGLLLTELENDKSTEPSEILKRIKSTQSEVYAYYWLKKKYNFRKIRKILEDADWLCDDNTAISVKHITDLDFNCQCIANTLLGLMSIKENGLIRRFCDIELDKLENVDDEFRKKVLVFLRSDLLNIIIFANSSLLDYESLQIESKKYYYKGSQQSGYLKILLERLPQRGEGFNINISEDRQDDSRKHRTQITFKPGDQSDKGNTYINFDTSVFWVGSSFTWPSIENTVSQHMVEFDTKFDKLIKKKSKKRFIGWIDISIHPKHEEYIKSRRNEIEEKLRNTVAQKGYKIIVSFNPQWPFDPIPEELYLIEL